MAVEVDKKCRKCGGVKPNTLEFYHKHSTRPDGTSYLHPECRECRRGYMSGRYSRDDVKDRHREYFRDYSRKRRKKDPSFKILRNLRTRIYLSLRDGNKSASMSDLLGCTVDQLWDHLEGMFQPGMTRSNYGEWHVDHILPCCKFDLTCDIEQHICFHYTNLQPLWSRDNLAKGGRM